MKKIFCICFILSLSCYSISYAQSTMAPDGSWVGYDSSDSESTNDTFGQDWNNFGQWAGVTMKKTYLAIAFLIAGITILSSCSKEPDNYDDCILEHIKGNQTKQAVNLIDAACYEKFSASPKQE